MGRDGEGQTQKEGAPKKEGRGRIKERIEGEGIKKK